MKIRSGFVSNSSSSSFIVALKNKKDICPHCGRSDPDFFDYLDSIKNSRDDDTFLICEGDYVMGKIAMDNISIEKPKMDLLNEYIKDRSSWRVGIVSISYHDNFANDLFNKLKQSGNLVVIDGI